jgi:type II restriction enzyme
MNQERLNGQGTGDKIMVSAKEHIDNLINDIESGKINPSKSWNLIKNFKDQYVTEISEQSWHVYIGNKFQKVIHAIIKGYIKRLKHKGTEYQGLEILTEGEINKNEIFQRKMAIRYGEDFYLLPDVDSALVWYDNNNIWNSEVLAIISCKTSLRERIAQSCYWKLKLLASDLTEGINVFLATTDNDGDFDIKEERERYKGKHRNRIISEHELDGVYILKDGFEVECESNKVKAFDKIFDDIVNLIKKR